MGYATDKLKEISIYCWKANNSDQFKTPFHVTDQNTWDLIP